MNGSFTKAAMPGLLTLAACRQSGVRVVRWKLTAEQAGHLQHLTGQRQFLFGIPVVIR